MANNSPIGSQVGFSWGAFCLRVIQDQNTGLVSIIDIIQGLQLEQVVATNLDPDNPKSIAISLDSMYVTSLFKRLDNSNNEIDEDLSIEFLQTGLPSVVFQVKASMRSAELSTFINLNLSGLSLIVTPLKGSNYTFEVIYRMQGQELGRLILPVTVEFKLLDNE
jgi:hypothetical protein